jgi:hypothetical protein
MAVCPCLPPILPIASTYVKGIISSISNTECVVSSQLFEVLLRLVKALEGINDSYKIGAKKSKITPPAALQETMGELKRVSETIPIGGQRLQRPTDAGVP